MALLAIQFVETDMLTRIGGKAYGRCNRQILFGWKMRFRNSGVPLPMRPDGWP